MSVPMSPALPELDAWLLMSFEEKMAAVLKYRREMREYGVECLRLLEELYRYPPQPGASREV